MTKKTETKNNIEREYVIPLRKQVKKVPRYKKANKAIRTIKEFLVRHMKVYDKDLNKIKLDKSLNEFVWFKGIRNPPHKIKVKANKDGEFVRVELVDVPKKLEFKKLREEKRDKKALEIVEKKKSMMQKMKQATQSPTSSAEASSNESKVQTPVKESVEKEDKKVEETEKKSAVVEEGAKLEKAKAKEIKHTTKVKTPKQEKENKKEYDKSSRGH